MAAEELGTCLQHRRGRPAQGPRSDYGQNAVVQVASRPLRRGRALPGTPAPCHRDQDRPGRQARHRRAPAWRRRSARRCRRNAHDPARHRRHLARASPRHLLHRGPAPAGVSPSRRPRGYAKAGGREDRGRAQRRRPSPAARRAAGADVVVVDGFRGGTGAAPARIRDNVGIPLELALASGGHAPARRGHPRRGVMPRGGRDPSAARRHGARGGAGGGRRVHRASAALMRDGVPPCASDCRERAVQLGHRHAAPGAGQAPGPRGGRAERVCQPGDAHGTTRSRR